MAFIKFGGERKMIPEGETVFKITNALYEDETKKLEIHLQTKEGLIQKEWFDLNSKGQFGRMMMFAENCGFDTKTDGIDHEDFIGCFIGANVYHEEWNGKTKAKLGMFFPANGFEGVVSKVNP